ncbi:MAG: hypothetical protein JSR55_00770 [Proteobacteria bacterium]|nr:hypothetical protein [Pseudomonadota bacterium]
MSKGLKLLFHLAISANFAVATPAIAAGLTAGTSAPASAKVAAVRSAIYSAGEKMEGSIHSDASPFIATHGPAKLSVLVGNDQAAWESAHSVHVDFHRKPH